MREGECRVLEFASGVCVCACACVRVRASAFGRACACATRNATAAAAVAALAGRVRAWARVAFLVAREHTCACLRVR
eukprot:3304012-Pleurochrysis_carterae.AAC.1